MTMNWSWSHYLVVLPAIPFLRFDSTCFKMTSTSICICLVTWELCSFPDPFLIYNDSRADHLIYLLVPVGVYRYYQQQHSNLHADPKTCRPWQLARTQNKFFKLSKPLDLICKLPVFNVVEPLLLEFWTFIKIKMQCTCKIKQTLRLRFNYSFYNIKHIKKAKIFHMLNTLVSFSLTKFMLQMVTTDIPFSLI